MMDHRDVVGREMHVELEAVGARRDPEIEARQRVLGTQGTGRRDARRRAACEIVQREIGLVPREAMNGSL